MKRDKRAIIASGIDPELKQLRKLQAIKSNQAKKFTRACESVEFYWERVDKALREQGLEGIAS